MFGFGKKPDHFADLMEHLVERSGMRARFASAFLSAYKDDVSKRFEEGTRRAEKTLAGASRIEQMMFNPAELYDFTIVAQAYVGYLQDLRRGRHVGTDVELAIWALLVTHIDLVQQTDKGFAGWIDGEFDNRFPKLLETVYA
jgi:predicted DNA-binding protein (UPF0278 family)